MNTKLTQACGIALLAISGLMLAGCDANGDGSIDGSGTVGGGGDTNGNGTIDPNEFPNDGSVPTDVTDNGTPITGRFICDLSLNKAKGVTTDAGTGGVVGGILGGILGGLGGQTLNQLLASVKDKDLAIDTRLDTHSTFTLTATGLGILSSVDQVFNLAATVPSRDYAVFAIGFPGGTVDLSLLNTLDITTFLGTTEQETRAFTQNALELLGVDAIGDDRIYLGMKVTKPYDHATIGLSGGLLSVNVGEAMFVHEFCTKGHFVAAP
ncbi:hypothetical protein [Solimonas sp. K1W22B-7]|uniref:hypothetical protein n=1 Tax=Solimonas sp. K1W22B-7 TaxID=2303331 RepID=UPI0013C41612|nr:hypothetical protein [Solimonas sp. K1W22B-7]